MHTTLFLILALIFSSTHALAKSFDHQHQAFAKILKNYVGPDGFVEYAKLQKDIESKSVSLKAYLDQLQQVSNQTYTSWSEPEKMAFLINAYNAFTLDLVLGAYPVSSIKKTVGFLSNPWKKDFFKLLDGQITDLDSIEHGFLREKFSNPLIHAAINCASYSCPRLADKPYVPNHLDRQLKEAMEAFLRDRLRNRYDPKKGILYLSKIFDWFEEDFVKSHTSLRNFILKYGPPEAQAAYQAKGEVEYLDYDWSLNDAEKSRQAASK